MGKRKEKTVRGFLTGCLAAGMVAVTASAAWAGTWYVSGDSYTYFTGSPGNRGGQVNASILVDGSTRTYQAKIDGQRIINQWLCHIYRDTGQEKWSYFGSNGKEYMDWQQIDGNWYNFGGGGTMLTGWHRIDQQYYYFDLVTGIMKTSGTEQRDGVTYEFSSDGLSKKTDGLKENYENGDGWLEENGKWYYMRGGQKVINEWLDDGDQRYYVGSDGARYSSAHFIDGDLYMFDGRGKMMRGGSTYLKGVKYILGADGKGIPTAMSNGELVSYSPTSAWCDLTYEISWRGQNMYSYDYKAYDALVAGMQQSWGVTTADECRATIQKLYEAGIASEDKAEKAWNFARGMMLCNMGYYIKWWDETAMRDMQLGMAPAIQQSFSSWDEYHDAYMEGYRRWSGGSGESYEKRLRMYEYVKNNKIREIDWNTKLERSWQ